jgi:dephospho-CoA kinase
MVGVGRIMFVIGLTGGIGSGKSVVSRMLEKLGAAVIDADQVGHEAYLPHTETWEAVVAHFGKEILQQNDEIDRKKLGAKVFSDPDARDRLNAIMHPRMYTMIEERIERLREQNAEAVVVEAAVLIEAGWVPLVDEVWTVTAPEEAVVQRLHRRNGASEEQTRQMVHAQLTSEERIQRAVVVIENSQGMEELRQRVQEAWHRSVEGRSQ